jgi:multicomponent Na+:H+ antiporter subunit B
MSREGQMTPIVTTIAGLLLPFAFIFSFYVILHGHLTPGGGFQGGAIGASAIVMLIVAYGAKNVKEKVSENGLSMLESLGGAMFVIVGIIGFIAASTFLANFLVGETLFGEIPKFGSNNGVLNSGGVLPLLNIAVGLKVIGGLASVVLIMALSSKKEGEEE